MKKLIVLSIALPVLLSSCYVNRNTVGSGPVGKDPNVTTYSQAKQLYLFKGLVALNNPDPAKPTDGNYQIKTCQNLVDDVVSSITFGVFNMRTIKILVKRK
jgi:Bor protein